jgi:glycosyltransferase involved in cell wall biosynthesis
MLSPESQTDSPCIAILLPDLRIGGAERVSVDLARELKRLGYSVEFVLMQAQGEFSEQLPDGVRIFGLGAPRFRKLFLPLAAYIKERSPDVVIANMWPLTVGAVVTKLLTRARTRCIVVEHSPLSIQYSHRGLIHWLALRASIHLFYPFADKRIAVSSGVADDTSVLGRISRESIDVIHNPVPVPNDASTFDESVEHAWRGWKGPRLITVGTLKRQKNHALLIHAFKRLLALQDARLLILGAGELAEATAVVAREQEVADKVFMPGAKLDPMPYYRSADLFVLSSDYEGLPTVIIEALGAGLPVVSTDCRSGPAEILENGRYGLLAPVGDADALAEAMTEALAKTWDREQLKQRALDFSPEKIVKKYIDVVGGG